MEAAGATVALSQARLGSRARLDRALWISIAAVAAIVLLAVTAPLWWTHSPTSTEPLIALQAPSWTHPMGTDAVGRDMLARVLGGARISLLAAASVSLVGGSIGALLGIVAGLGGRIVDGVLMRVFDAMLAFPPVIFAMAVTLGIGVGLVTACVGVALSAVPYGARVVRSDVLRVRSAGHVEAAHALGVPPTRIVRGHVVPHVLPTILVQLASLFSFSIVAIAALGFIGLGAQIPTPEWGTTITDGSPLVLVGKWWVSTFPGIGLLIITAASAVIAERIRVRLDPRAETRRPLL
jgi:peptide/nickel transport system permease protein